MSDASLFVERRETFGKNSNRRLRASGQVPAVVYGAGRDPVNIQVGRRDVEALLRKTADENPIFQLELAGTNKKRHAMIRDLHADAVTGNILHIDFLRVEMDQELQASVRLELKGQSPGVKLGGLLDWLMREVDILALPDRIPGHIDIDISELEIGDHLETRHLELPEGVRLVDDGSRVVLSLQGPQVSAIEEEEDEEIEPEVIAKGKVED